VETDAGDVLYVPTWFWHRVEYLPNIVAVSVSLFEVTLLDMARNHPMFFATVWPNLVKEIFGINTQ